MSILPPSPRLARLLSSIVTIHHPFHLLSQPACYLTLLSSITPFFSHASQAVFFHCYHPYTFPLLGQPGCHLPLLSSIPLSSPRLLPGCYLPLLSSISLSSPRPARLLSSIVIIHTPFFPRPARLLSSIVIILTPFPSLSKTSFYGLWSSVIVRHPSSFFNCYHPLLSSIRPLRPAPGCYL